MSDTCPTCGGPCTKDPQTAIEMGMMATAHYRSLVKGEVVAEGWAEEGDWCDGKHGDRHLPVYSKRAEDGSGREEFPVLVIRAKKEDSVIQERYGR